MHINWVTSVAQLGDCRIGFLRSEVLKKNKKINLYLYICHLHTIDSTPRMHETDQIVTAFSTSSQDLLICRV